MKKNFLSTFLLCTILIVCLFVDSSKNEKKEYFNQEFGFNYTQYYDENGCKVTTYFNKVEDEKLIKLSSNNFNYEYIKAVLRTIGMKDKFIEKLSFNQLEKYKNAQSISGIITYNRIDENGNISIVTEDEANEAAVSYSTYSGIDPNPSFDYDGDSSGYPSYYSSYGDEYIEILYVVSYLGDGKYLYSTDAEWITVPLFRGEDSIGSCAQESTVINSSRTGWYGYERITHKYPNIFQEEKINEEYIENTFSTNDFSNAINGNWYGSVAIFDLPINLYDEFISIYYKNFIVHYEYEGTVLYPEQELNFCTFATYEHTKLALNISPSASIDLGGISPSIGISLSSTSDVFDLELSDVIRYRP